MSIPSTKKILSLTHTLRKEDNVSYIDSSFSEKNGPVTTVGRGRDASQRTNFHEPAKGIPARGVSRELQIIDLKRMHKGLPEANSPQNTDSTEATYKTFKKPGPPAAFKFE